MPSRRSVILGSGALAITGMAAMLARPAERGAMHEAYFAGLSAALKRAGLMRPTLVIDRARLNAKHCRDP